MVGVAVSAPRGEQDGARAVADQCDQGADDVGDVLGDPAVLEVEPGVRRARRQDVESLLRLDTASLGEPGRWVSRRPGVAVLPRGGGEQVDRQPEVVRGRQQPTGAERLVVGVRRDDDHPLDPAQVERRGLLPAWVVTPGRRRRPGAVVGEGAHQGVPAEPAPYGLSVASSGAGVGRQIAPQSGGVALGVLLAQVQAQVGDGRRVPPLAGQRPRAEGVVGGDEDPLGCLGHHLAHPPGQQRGR